MIKSLFTFLFLLGTVSYFAQGSPRKFSMPNWNQNNERRAMSRMQNAGHIPQIRKGSRSTERADEDCKCGRKNIERIVGGEDARSGEWCWQAKVQLFPPEDDGTFLLCGGSVITNKTVLCAAHCFHGNEDHSMKVNLGAQKLFYDDNEVPYDVEYVAIHPDYEPRSKANDYAVMILAKLIQYTQRICSVCLANSKPEVGTPATVTGWGNLQSGGGSPEVLQQVVVNIVSKSECEKSYGPLDDSQLCAAAPGKDACQGDSGGPLVQEGDDGVWYQVGVVSAGIGCADPKYPGLYADVFEKKQWIMDNAEGQYCSA